MEYCSAAKENEIMRFAGKWMDLETVVLSEGTQNQKDKCHMFSHLRFLGQSTDPCIQQHGVNTETRRS